MFAAAGWRSGGQACGGEAGSEISQNVSRTDQGLDSETQSYHPTPNGHRQPEVSRAICNNVTSRRSARRPTSLIDGKPSQLMRPSSAHAFFINLRHRQPTREAHPWELTQDCLFIFALRRTTPLQVSDTRPRGTQSRPK